ncbi:PadR family transcriptional regulator [Nocardia brasiliensis]|uniref:PadR family transcriptional regulator n=1 Tax=Nocardia brasiliensis TaxID=37326 RepID=UPI00245424B0|nr:helix-turn-helix transcriptional regulator [Nocardia brasiliensis]
MNDHGEYISDDGNERASSTPAQSNRTWNPLRARRERNIRRVAAVLLALPDDRHFGYELARRAGISSGAAYPILWRMRADTWLQEGWEEEPSDRPPRRYYWLTVSGQRELTALLRAT